MGATGEELKEGKGVQKCANLKRSCLDPALSPCPTRRRGGGGSLRAFRRARNSEEVNRVDDSTRGIEASQDHDDKDKREERREKREEGREMGGLREKRCTGEGLG